MQKNPAPAPIFNHRKRPRQAVFADPQNDAIPGPSGAALAPDPSIRRFSDLMLPQGFGNDRIPTMVYQQRQQPATRSVSNTDVAPVGSRNPQIGLANSSCRGSLRQQAFGNQRGRLTSNSVNRGRGNSANYNTRPQRWEKFQANSQQPFSQLSGYEQRIGGSYHPGPCGDTGQQTGPSINYGRQKQQTPRSRVGFQRQDLMNDRKYKCEIQPTGVSFDCGHDFDDNLGIVDQTNPSMSTNTPISAVKRTSSDLEKSLHVITCTVAGMRRWNKFKDNIQLLFELYGYLDSAVTKQKNDCREFLLRDERKDAVKCLFYEVDRQLPKPMRGQRIRCVGSFDSKTECFRVMSIRPTLGTEGPLSKLLISKSDQMMHRITKTLREI